MVSHRFGEYNGQCHIWRDFLEREMVVPPVGTGLTDGPPNGFVILSERSESKDLGTKFTANLHEMRRSLGFISFRSG